MGRRKTHEEYVQELLEKEILYTPITKYEGSLISILHECPEGHQWPVTPNKILSGKGCPKCSSNRLKTTEEYAEELLSKGISYKVLESYMSAITPILHYCTNEHTWRAAPTEVLRGSGCPSCASYGFNPNKSAILYYIKITPYIEKKYYKVGITNRSIEDRFSQDKDKTIQILMYKDFSLGYDARLEEQIILNKYKDKRVTIPTLLKSGGNTELFEVDILGLDT